MICCSLRLSERLVQRIPDARGKGRVRLSRQTFGNVAEFFSEVENLVFEVIRLISGRAARLRRAVVHERCDTRLLVGLPFPMYVV